MSLITFKMHFTSGGRRSYDNVIIMIFIAHFPGRTCSPTNISQHESAALSLELQLLLIPEPININTMPPVLKLKSLLGSLSVFSNVVWSFYLRECVCLLQQHSLASECLKVFSE